MLERVDRVQLAVSDRARAEDTFRHVLGAEKVREDTLAILRARRTVMQAGISEFELLEPDGDGPVSQHIAQWGDGLFAAGFSTKDVVRLAEYFQLQGVLYDAEGGQLFIAPEQTFGMRAVISPAVERKPVGLISFLYEVTNVVGDWKAAAERYTAMFALDASRFHKITSAEYGYTGTLTLFDPPGRLDRVEVTEITDREKAMGRFHTRRGDSLYMCFVEAPDVKAIAARLRGRNLRFADLTDRDQPDSLFIHPSALCGMLMGVSATNAAWFWSGRPDLAGVSGGRGH